MHDKVDKQCHSNMQQRLLPHNNDTAAKIKSKDCDFKQLTDLVEGHNIAALDILVHWFLTQMFLNESVNRDKVINNCHHDLQLLDSISHWYKLGCSRQ
jgi:hypothetical protein